MRRFTVLGRADRWQPIALVPPGPTPQMRQLDHHRATMFVAGIRQAMDMRHDLVFIGKNVVENRRAVFGHGG